MKIGITKPKVLDFDIESRPLGWYGGDFVHSEPTIIAASWVGQKKVHSWHLRLEDHATSMEEMLLGFKALYDEADIVTGHYIRGYDLTRIQEALFEFGLPLLGQKWTSDTKGDLIKLSGISKSQQNLGSVVDTPAPKVGMSMMDWRKANRLEPAGIELALERCVGDVIQHKQMRQELIEAGVLGPGKLWHPGPGLIPGYEA